MNRTAAYQRPPSVGVLRLVVWIAAVGIVTSLFVPWSATGSGTSVEISLTCDPTKVGVPTRCSAVLSETASTSEVDGLPIRIGAFDNEQGGQPSLAEATERASRFDVITATPYQYRANVAAMRAANPALQLNVYVNGTHSKSTSLPEHQYCHDATGARITSTGTWTGNLLMNPSDAGWRSTLIANVQNALATSGYDGVFLDVLGRGTMSYNVTGLCIDPRTGKAYTAADWERDTSLLAKAVKDATGRRVVANGASRGMLYFGSPSSSVVAEHVDGGLAEGFTRNGAFFDGFYTESQIVKDIEMVRAGGQMQVLAKDWRTVSDATKQQEMRYAFAAFLLGTDGTDVFGWTGSQGSKTSFDPLWDVDLGAARGAYVSIGGGRYQRSFTRGTVTVDTVAHTGAISVAPSVSHDVTWQSSAPGTFSETGCGHDASGTTTCTASYVPAAGSAGVHTITATYAGTGTSTGPASTDLDVGRRATATAVACTTPLDSGERGRCTVTVTDASDGRASSPTGRVEASIDGSSLGACALVEASASAASCDVELAATDGAHQVTATYAGDADHDGSAGAPVTIEVESPSVVVDTSAPTVAITSPLEGNVVIRGRKLTVTAEASDDTGVVKVVFAEDGVVRCTDASAAWSCSFTMPKHVDHVHALTVTAYDAAGNAAEATRTITCVKR